MKPIGSAAAVLWGLAAAVLVGIALEAFARHSRESDVRFVDHFDLPVLRFDAATSMWTSLAAPPERPTAVVGVVDGGVLLFGDRRLRTDDGEHFTEVDASEKPALLDDARLFAGGRTRSLDVPAGVFEIGNRAGQLVRTSGQVERFAFPGMGAPLLAGLGDELVLAVAPRADNGRWDSWLIDGTHVRTLGPLGPPRSGAFMAPLGGGRALVIGGVWSQPLSNDAAFLEQLVFVAAMLAFVSLGFVVLRNARGRPLIVFGMVTALGALVGLLLHLR